MIPIHLLGGEKGGMGKSFVCQAGIEYHLARKIPALFFDTDRSNPDVLRVYKEVAGVRPAILSEAEKYEVAASTIYNAALNEQLPVLVNLGAASFRSLKIWIEKNYVFRSSKLNDIVFYNWFISDGSSASLQLFEQSLDYFGDKVQHVFVENYGMTERWGQIPEYEALADRMKKENVMVIEFPRFVGDQDRELIRTLGLTFSAAQQHDAFDTLAQQRIHFYLEDVYDEFDRVGVFNRDVT